MHCGNCVAKVRDAFTRMADVVNTEVSLQPPIAKLQVNKALATTDVNAALAGLGNYSAKQIGDNLPNVEVVQAQATSIYPLYLIFAYIAGTVGLIGFASGNSAPG